MLLAKPAFTVIAVLSLALGIGANTAIFSVINTALFKRLPYKATDELAVIWEKLKTVDQVELAPDDYSAYIERNQSFASIAAAERVNLNLTGADDPVRLEGQMATASLFPTLGVAPMIGRTFTPEEDRDNARVAVLSYKLWRSQFAGDPQIVGRNIALNGRDFTVIGVMPAEFQYPPPMTGYHPSEIWTPRSIETERSRDAHNLLTIGRLKPGVTLQQAKADLEAVSRQRAQEAGRSSDGTGLNLIPMNAQIGRQQRPALLVLAAAVGFVLLIACANVANLLLSLAASRQKEIAVRLALGANRSRILRQLLTESLLLSLLGGAAGLFLAVWMSDAIRTLAAGQIPRAELIAVDGRVLLFTALISIVTGLIFGFAPALHASGTDLNATLKDGSRGAIGGTGAALGRLRGALVVIEVGLSLVLLAGAGLLIKSFWNLQQVDPGFNPHNLLGVEITLPAVKYAEQYQRAAFYRQALEKISALPGVQSASIVNHPPFSGRRGIGAFKIQGRPEPTSVNDTPLADFRIISPDYFRMMGIPVLQGRVFSDGDGPQASAVAVINRASAQRFWPGENPIGKRIGLDDVWVTIVGVVGDVRQSGLDEEAAPHLYVPYQQSAVARTGLLVRTSIDPLNLVNDVRAQIQALDPEQPIYNVKTMTDAMAASTAPRRLNLVLLGGFALLALTLAAVGIYGVMSHQVTMRTGEIGLRMALGARPGDVLRLVIAKGMRLALVGVAAGLATSFALTRVMASLVFEVSPTDPITFAAIALVLTGVALVACWIPARRATKVDPMVALRAD
jgi:putative ABC transport system permease protein